MTRNRQKFRLTLGEPLPRRSALTCCRAVTVAAGIVGDAFVRAILAALNVSAERSDAAGLDRRHDLQLAEADMAGVGLAAAPWAKTSATSRASCAGGAVRRAAIGLARLTPSRSSGILTSRMVLTATRV